MPILAMKVEDRCHEVVDEVTRRVQKMDLNRVSISLEPRSATLIINGCLSQITSIKNWLNDNEISYLIPRD